MSTFAWAAFAVVVLVVLAAGLSAVETLLTRLDLVRALRLEEEEAPGAPRLVWLLEHRPVALNVVLVLTVIVRVGAALTVVALATTIGSGVAGVLIAAGALIVVSLVIGEIVPRTLVLRHLESAGLRLAPAAVPAVQLMEPLVRPLVGLGRSLVRSRGEVSGPYAPDNEVEAHLEDAGNGESLEEEELAMIQSIFELGDTLAREIMVPRPDMVMVDHAWELQPVVDTLIEHGYSRVPVYEETKDNIVGVIYAKDVLRRLALDPEATGWRDLVREPTFVPETKRIDDLLRMLQRQTVHQALVVDEHGAVVGLVTIEDILEEIVGEIVDEHDREVPLVEQAEDGQLLVDARLAVDELNELLGSELPADGWDSVGGLVLGLLGRVPDPGEDVEIEGVRLVAEQVQGRRIRRVLVGRGDDVAGAEEPRREATT